MGILIVLRYGFFVTNIYYICDIKNNNYEKSIYSIIFHIFCIMITYIYILQDPITKDVRYVGKTNNPKLSKKLKNGKSFKYK